MGLRGLQVHLYGPGAKKNYERTYASAAREMSRVWKNWNGVYDELKSQEYTRSREERTKAGKENMVSVLAYE